MSRKIKIAFLWHMHQPWYLWEETGDAAMPWVRLHALKDYYDMAYLASKCNFPVTFNLVPSLLEQLDLIVQKKSTDAIWEAFCTPYAKMDEGMLNLISTNFFDVNFDKIIKPSARYLELFSRRNTTNDWRVFSKEDICDIKMHFVLGWFGETLKTMPQIAALIRKDKNYSEEEIATVAKIADARIAEIIPFYSKLWRDGKIELTFSPYFHPILPLLCDVKNTRVSNANLPPPQKPFSYPIDADKHIRTSFAYCERIFGQKFSGMWPSEGSVSPELLPLFADCGVQYFFSDEEILRKSSSVTKELGALLPDQLYNGHKLIYSGKELFAFFRDKHLSDKIGFDYCKMSTQDAVNDFFRCLERIRDTLDFENNEHIISVILDGENAWEFFDGNGVPFLTLLYERLKASTSFEPTTFAAYILQNARKMPLLENLGCGSWIRGDFSTWAGSTQKNRAWELLADARAAFLEKAPNLSPKNFEGAYNAIMIAEGSDWFWWFGDTNYTPYIDIFDSLFRHHITRVYRYIDLAVPNELFSPVYAKMIAAQPVRKPLQFMSPSIEGKSTNFFEWSSAGYFNAANFRGTMHSSASAMISRLYYGFDRKNLFLRIDSQRDMRDFFADAGKLTIEILAPIRVNIELSFSHDSLVTTVTKIDGTVVSEFEIDGLRVVCDQICELKLPFNSLSASQGMPLKLVFIATGRSGFMQHFPPGGQFIEIVPPDDDFETDLWFV